MFYWIYLALFSVAVILPTCNNYGLDIVVLFWTLFDMLEIALRYLQSEFLIAVVISSRIKMISLLSMTLFFVEHFTNCITDIRCRF